MAAMQWSLEHLCDGWRSCGDDCLIVIAWSITSSLASLTTSGHVQIIEQPARKHDDQNVGQHQRGVTKP